MGRAPTLIGTTAVSVSACLGLAFFIACHAGEQALRPEELDLESRTVTTKESMSMASEAKAFLEPGSPIEEEIEGGAHRDLFLALTTGQYLHIVVEQLGADVELQLLNPDGETLTREDRPTGDRGAEQVLAVADRSGDFRLRILSLDPPEKSGRFRARIEATRPTATPEERRRTDGAWAFARGETLFNRGDLDPALEEYRTALGHFQAAFDAGREGEAWQRIGRTLQRSEKVEEALEPYVRALELAREGGNSHLEGTLLNDIGRIHQRLGRWEEARSSYQTARQVFHTLSNPLGEATALSNLGLVHKRLGEVQEALDSYRAALELHRETGRPDQKLIVETNLGKLLITLGKLEEAGDIFGSCLETAETVGDRSGKAICLNSLGDIHQRRGEYAEARSYVEQALELHRELGDSHHEGVAENSLGTAWLNGGQPDQALPHYRRALEQFERLGDLSNQAITLLNLGRYFYEKGLYKEAAEHHRRALPLYRQAGNRAGQASTLYGEARAEAHQGNLTQAVERIQAALAAIEGLRSETNSLDLRSSFVATKQDYWELYIDLLMRRHQLEPEAGHDRRALEACERWRARSLLDLLAEAQADVRGEVPEDLLRRESEIQSQLNELQLHRLQLRDEPGQEAALGEIESQQRSLSLDLDLVRSRIRTASPRYASLAQFAPIETPGIQRHLLHPDTQLLEYFLGQQRSWGWVVSRRRVRSFPLPPRQEIEAVAQELYGLLQSRASSRQDDRRRAASRLSEMILAPVSAELDADRLLIVGDGALSYIPFAALPSPMAPTEQTRYLVEDFEIVSLPSASVLAVLREQYRHREPTESLRIAIFADPVYQPHDARVTGEEAAAESPEVAWPEDLLRSARDLSLDDFKRLPYSRVEAESIAELFAEDHREMVLDFKARRESLLGRDLKAFSILHFATHGLLNRDHPDLSGLVLSLVDEQGEPRDGFVRLHEIYGLDLKAELVTLSACKTGLGKEVRGEGLVGLTRGFMYAGSPRVLVSLWSVDDAATAELMRRYYQQLLRDPEGRARSFSSALRQTQISMLREEEWHAPYAWAGFVFQGEWQRPLKLQLPDDEIGQEYVGGAERDPDSDQDLPIDGSRIRLDPEPPTSFTAHSALPRPTQPLSQSRGAAPTQSESPDMLVFNGLHGFSGRPAFPSLTEEEVASLALGEKVDREFLDRFLQETLELSGYDSRRHDPPEDVHPQALEETGWGVIFAEDLDPMVHRALLDLLDLRQEQAGRQYSHYFQTYHVSRGTGAAEFLDREGVPLGETAHPDRMPYYLLLVGSPEQIPFQFQYDLDLQYAVGRLHFDQPEEYRQYADNVIDAERGRTRRPRRLTFFGTAQPGDRATWSTSDELITPLAESLEEARGEWEVRTHLGSEATKEQLARLLGGEEKPAVLFAAAHGLRFDPGDALQRDFQGALVCADWSLGADRREKLSSRHFFSARDLDGDGFSAEGLIAFLFACYGAGTPEEDDFGLDPKTRLPVRRATAPTAFLSRLGQRLLAHPEGGALALVGHVERTWTTSFNAEDGALQLETFRNTLKRLLDGHPIGSAMSRFDLRYGQLSALLRALEGKRDQLAAFDRKLYSRLWRGSRDARNFIVVGDPAVRPALGSW